MYNVSADYFEALNKSVHKYALQGTVGEVPFTADNLLYQTLTITNQCSKSDEIQLGSVYNGQLKATFINMDISRNDWKNASISVSEGLMLGDGTYEYVPLGIFVVAECNHTLKGVEVTAYDYMTKFDVLTGDFTTGAAPYSLLTFACSQCGVVLGTTQAEIEAMPNGTTVMEIYSSNDIETYRDLIYWVAQTLCSIATINRDGELELRQYQSITSVADINEYKRFSNCSFSDFSVQYTGATVQDLMSDEIKYVNVDPDTGLVYPLGDNPLIQGENIQTMAENIITRLSEVSLVPFSATMQGGALYDLCDCLHFTGGIAGGVYGAIMAYTYTFGRGYKIEGFGKNPDLAKAESRAEKAASAASRAANSKAIFYTYSNPDDLTIGDEETHTAILFGISSNKNSSVLFHAEIPHEIDTNENYSIGTDTYTEDDCNITVEYYINNRKQDYSPVYVEQDTDNVLHLMFYFTIASGGIVEFIVKISCQGGTMFIPAGKIKAYVYGSEIGSLGDFGKDINIAASDVIPPFRFSELYSQVINHLTEGVDYVTRNS